MNPFKPQNGPIDRPKRNVYDLSYTSHLTCNFGTLYPVFCKKVSPGDSMSIETTFGLRAQPMIFPVQSKIRADIHYFYVRNRTLWNNFMDFYGKTKEGLVHPYIERPVSDFKTGSIYDYMGIPTTIAEGGYYYTTGSFNPFNIANCTFVGFNNPSFATQSNDLIGINSFSNGGNITKLNRIRRFSNWIPYIFDYVDGTFDPLGFHFRVVPETQNLLPNYLGMPTSFFPTPDEFVIEMLTIDLPTAVFDDSFDGQSLLCSVYFLKDGYDVDDSNSVLMHSYTTRDCSSFSYTLSKHPRYSKWQLVPDDPDVICTALNRLLGYGKYYSFVFYVDKGSPLFSLFKERHTTLTAEYSGFGDMFAFKNNTDRLLDSSELTSLPWCGTNKTLKINALPYRAYEAIYNSFYRNAQVSPFKLIPNGQPEYNRYVTNLGDGADSFKYQLYQRNYEYDFLTGAFHSPQQGLAPLIGLTVNNPSQEAIFRFKSSQINNGAEITATTKITDDGQVIGITGYDPSLPQSNIDRLMTAINYGISINDIRQTNALQKWLEKNIRRGYRYKDQLMSHFGVKVEYNELLMPEFIGGVTQDIKTDTIYQMATNESGYLGDFAGRAGVVGNSQHRVSKFCDEAGFIIGIMSIVPTPVYSQVPAGYAFDNNLFDYFFPEFSKIGMQPIFNYQVTPLQSQDDLNGVFGYQRPYWDLIRSVDEVHGEFRTTASGYVIQRHFADTPILNQNFTQIHSDSLNDVFMISNEEVSNQFMGMIYFNVKRKTSIPMFGIPSIE